MSRSRTATPEGEDLLEEKGEAPLAVVPYISPHRLCST